MKEKYNNNIDQNSYNLLKHYDKKSKISLIKLRLPNTDNKNNDLIHEKKSYE